MRYQKRLEKRGNVPVYAEQVASDSRVVSQNSEEKSEELCTVLLDEKAASTDHIRIVEEKTFLADSAKSKLRN